MLAHLRVNSFGRKLVARFLLTHLDRVTNPIQAENHSDDIGKPLQSLCAGRVGPVRVPVALQTD